MNASCTRKLTRRRLIKWSALSLTAGVSGALAAPEEGFTSLFNGVDLSGWDGDPMLWVVEDGVLIGRSPGIGYNDFLTTTKSYGDFVLRFSVQLLDDTGNSGVQFRSQRVSGSMEMIGYQADIGPGWWGGLYDESRRRVTLAEADETVLKRALKSGAWNEYEVHAEGPRIRLKINGRATVDYEETDSNIEQSGLIAVQIHSGPPLEVRFKDIRIKEL